MGVTHSAVVTMNQGLSTADDHIDAIKRFRDATAQMAA
jgi:hypothetical protein